MRNGEISHWVHETGGPPAPRPALGGDGRADIVIVGAGYTGLWAAYYLKKADPTLDILIVEREFAGFGASGRNGGWLSGGFAWSRDRYLTSGSRDAVRAMIRAMIATVDEVIAAAAAEGIEAGIRPTDEVLIATNPAQLDRLRAEADDRRRWDVAEDGAHLIGAAQTRARVAMEGALGALVIPNVARIQPARLVQGLARVVERLGVRIVEQTEVTRIAPDRVDTARGTLRAEVILRATEGFTAGLQGHRRDWLPLNSAQVVTAPLPSDIWAKIGWQGYEIVGDYAHSYCYAQRTDDGRIVMGGRGIPYRFGSRSDHRGATDPKTIRRLTATLHRHFPATRDVPLDHAWCGVLGVPRDWCATVGFDPATGLGWAGGYVGVGVSTANLAGRSLRDLVLASRGHAVPPDLVTLPWVNRPLRRWEPEPLRWLALRGMYALLNAADRAEARRPGASILGRIGARLAGR